MEGRDTAASEGEGLLSTIACLESHGHLCITRASRLEGDSDLVVHVISRSLSCQNDPLR